MIIIENFLSNIKDCIAATAEIEEVEELKKCEDICFPSSPWSSVTFADTLNNANNKIYILYNTQLSKIVSYGVMCYCLDEADLAKIATLPDQRGKGIGGALLDLMLKDACNYGVLKTFLEVRESNAAARSLYNSRNFKEIGKRRNYYRNPTEDAVIMVREEAVNDI